MKVFPPDIRVGRLGLGLGVKRLGLGVKRLGLGVKRLGLGFLFWFWQEGTEVVRLHRSYWLVRERACSK